jgi:hypothetical protein
LITIVKQQIVNAKTLKKGENVKKINLKCLIILAVLVILVGSSSQSKQIMYGHVPADIAKLGLQPISRLDSAKQLSFAISLPLRDQEGLTSLLRQLYDPASPNYHNWLTPEQFTAQFGPTEEDYQSVIAFSKRNGLTVSYTHPNRVLLDVSGKVADIEKTFHVSMHNYKHPTESRTFYAPDGDPSIDLATQIMCITGLDNYSSVQPALELSAQSAQAQSGTGSVNGAYCGADFRAAYIPGTSLTGAGQSIGLMEFDDYHDKDISTYISQAKLTSPTLYSSVVTPIRIAVDGGVISPSGTKGEKEVALDIEMAIAMAPGIKAIYVYEVPPNNINDGSDSHWIDVLNRMANDNSAKQISCSWECVRGAYNESYPGLRDPGEVIFQQMAAQGQSFFSASGDKGNYTGVIAFPHESPSITHVGGTSLTTTGPVGSWKSETVWNSDGGNTGGGVSLNYYLPWWQSVVNVTSNGGSSVYRNMPDVAMVATNIWSTFYNGSSGIGSGTSFAAPLWAGYMALVNQQLASQGAYSAGFINPTIYAIAAGSRYATDFHDVTVGNNGTHSAGTGYDLCTGLGTPNGFGLASDLNVVFTLTSPAYYEPGGTGASYILNGSSTGPTSIHVMPGRNVTIQAVPQNSNWAFGGWSDGNIQNPRTIPISLSTSLYANFKEIHYSMDANAFVNNSQRKLVRTHDGWLHQVYTDGGHVWLEESTDGGSTWFFGNNGQPLDNGSGKCPSIDWYYNSAVNEDDSTANSIVIVFQQQSGSSYTIQYAPFWRTTKNGGYVNESVYPGYGKSNLLYPPAAFAPLTDPYTNNANPNISWGWNYNFVLTFEMKTSNGTLNPGIYWIYGSMIEIGLGSSEIPEPYYYGPILVSGTNGNSVNATVNLNKGVWNGDFDVVYEQDVASHTSSIMDVTAYCIYNNGWQTVQYPLGALSSSTGVSNYKPSMVQMPDDNIRVCWIRSLNGQPENSPFSVNVVYWNSAAPSQYSIYGWLTQSVSINVRDDNAKTFYAFSQYSMNNQWENYISNGSSYVKLSTTGNDVQLSNGPLSGSNTNMYVSSFYNTTLPYYFKNAGAIGTQLQKNSSDQISCGRGAVLGKGDFQFSYSLKNLSVDNNNIKFVDIPETPAYKIPNSLSTDTVKAIKAMRKWEKENDRYSKLDTLNTVLLSEPFAITGKSNMLLSEQSGFIDTIVAVNSLGNNGYVAYKLELIDNGTNKTIATIKESKFTSINLSSCKLSSYNLNVSNVGAKTVRVRITLNTNIDGLQGALVDEYGTIDIGALAKSTVNEITLQALEIIKEYALEQNYPNPFNPSSTIHYQIPNAGHVTLKVYDMLGREVATLVDGIKEVGSYSATFDGEKLASGVYIMRFVARSEEGKDFVQTKKMVLMK